MDSQRKANLDRAFNPRVVAVVGDKKASNYSWLRNVKDVKDARVYSVQIDENEIPGILELGFTNLKSLREVPGPIDYVICAVPRQVAPRIVQDCIDLKVGAVGLFTSGFAETGEDLGIQLQERLTQMARQAGLNLIGPNCMCLYHAAAGIRNGGAEQWIGPGGNASFLSNSGSITSGLVARARAAGILPNKAVSMGNSIALDQGDWLEYLGQDPGTQFIGIYAEGARDGRKFFRALREVAARKPVVIWKGGQTPEGARAAASHTGHLASPMVLWDAMIRQTGAIRADTLDELVDTLKALVLMKPTTGDRMGIIAAAGGPSVSVSDAFGRVNLKVPPLQEETYERLRPIVALVGGSWRNPVEGGGSLMSLERPREILDALSKDANTDVVVMEVNLGFIGRTLQRQGQGIDELVSMVRDFREASPKPFGMVSTWGQDEGAVAAFRSRLAESGIAVFATYQDAARAIRRMVDYHRAHAAITTGD